MKKVQLIPYRERDKRFKLKRRYIVAIRKAKNGDLIMPIPDDIVKAYHIKIGDVAIFKIVDKNGFIIRFVKKTMYGFVEKIDED
ncbi:hypothetical protein HYU07_01020 [Candidatus Woesearchaeota archaeon]|nr:hypothetical protein [Candidatus Woesearchaeota archaeon]